VVEFGCGAGRIIESLHTRGRRVIGLDRDPEAIAWARERVETARFIVTDLLQWVPPESMERRVGLVIAGGDLLPLFVSDDELRHLMRLATRILAADGLFAIDASRIDPSLLLEAAGRPEWSEDVRWTGEDGVEVVRESRLLPDAHGRVRVAQLQIRHRRDGASGFVDEREPFHVRAWLPDEIEGAADAAGLHVATRLQEDRLRWLLRSTHA
jgi:trans-aconitate methyltransferase